MTHERHRTVRFRTGTIEIDLKGKNVRQRSFLGVAFNVADERTFEAVYFRPFNFKAEEPMRGRSVQYVAWPANTWECLRKSAPGRFEKPVNPVPDPDGWFHAKIEVTDNQVRVFVDHAKEPSLVVSRLLVGGNARAAGLFVDSADGLYANLKFTPYDQSGAVQRQPDTAFNRTRRFVPSARQPSAHRLACTLGLNDLRTKNERA